MMRTDLEEDQWGAGAGVSDVQAEDQDFVFTVVIYQ